MLGLALTITAALAAPLAQNKLAYERQPLPAVMDRLRQIPALARDRPAAFRQMLTEAGCPPAERPSADTRSTGVRGRDRTGREVLDGLIRRDRLGGQSAHTSLSRFRPVPTPMPRRKDDEV